MGWIDANEQMPDADETVLLFMPDADGEPVWPGYFQCYGDSSWALADGMPAGRVTHWMHFPEAPEILL